MHAEVIKAKLVGVFLLGGSFRYQKRIIYYFEQELLQGRSKAAILLKSLHFPHCGFAFEATKGTYADRDLVSPSNLP